MQGVLDLVCVHRVLVDPWNPLCTKMIQTVCLRSAHARIEESNRRSHLWVWKLFVFRMYAVYSIYQFWNPFLSRSTVGWGQTNIKSRPAWKITLEILREKKRLFTFFQDQPLQCFIATTPFSKEGVYRLFSWIWAHTRQNWWRGSTHPKRFTTDLSRTHPLISGAVECG